MALPADPSIGLQSGFVTLAVAMTIFFAWWTKLRAIPLAWLFATGLLGWLGMFQIFTLPPRLMLVFIPGLVAFSILAWRSGWHERPLRLLVGFQAFRILVEILIHQAVVEGIAPPQMSWEGLNFDIVTGVTAAMFIPFVERAPRWLLHTWNGLGLALLINVVSVGMLSMPTPFQVFTPDNIWIGFFPFCWLPLILVMIAFLGHLVLFKRLTSHA